MKAASAREGGSRLVGFAASATEYAEHVFKQDTVGLQTKEQFTEKRANVERELEAQKAQKARASEEASALALSRKRAAAKVVATARLSFVDAEEEEEEEEDGAAAAAAKRARLKNPAVETDFLPDRDREREERDERERLRSGWLEEQLRQKEETIEVTFSYHDGAGHRNSINVKKGDTIGAFLRAVRDMLGPEFRELRAASVDSLLYVKEDVILPHHLTFHELIASKARGKSGPLFHFDVHDDVRLVGDARVEKDEAHAGKVMERHWFDRNKHIHPFNRMEPYDASKTYGSFSIYGGAK